MRNKRFPNYPDDVDYNTNAPSYYDELAKKNTLFKGLAKKIMDYDVELGKRFEQWDSKIENFPEDVEVLLNKWLNDGVLDDIINHDILNSKADKSLFEQFKLSTTAQLQQTSERNQQIAVNVLSFGAVGDGLADDTISIQQAIDFLISLGGGTLLFPNTKKTYLVTKPLEIKHATDIHISGSTITIPTSSYLFIISDSENITVDGVHFICGGTSSTLNIVRASKVKNLTIKNCQTDNAGLLFATADNETVMPKNAKGDYIFFNQRIRIINCKLNGEGLSGDGILLSGCKDVLVEGCNIANTPHDGVKTGGFVSENITIRNNTFSNCGDHGIDMYGSGRFFIIEGNVIVDCVGGLSLKSQGADSVTGLPLITSAYRALVVGNRILRCGNAFHVFRGRNILIKDNHIEACTGDHIIQINGDFQDVHVISNFFINNVQKLNVILVSPSLGLEEQEPEKIVSIKDNTFFGNTGSQIYFNHSLNTDEITIIAQVLNNQFRNVANRALGLVVDKIHLIFSKNQAVNSMSNFLMATALTENSHIIITENQVINLLSGVVFHHPYSKATDVILNNSWQ